MSDVSEIFFMLVPWPHARGTRLVDGDKLKLPRVCARCTDRECLDRFRAEGTGTGVASWKCKFEISTYTTAIENEKFLVVGVTNPQDGIITHRDRRNSFRKRRVWPPDVEELANRVSRLVASHRAAVKNEVQAVAAPLHDIKTMAGVIKNNVDALVRRLRQGFALDEDANEKALTRIEKTGELLISRLRLSDIMINPQVAAQGTAAPKNLMKMCYRLVKCFEDSAISESKRVYAEGASEKDVLVKDSFESIPFLLIENAVKYAEAESKINVYVQDKSRSVRIEVVSRGPLIPEDERSKIFRRGFRGSNVVAKGSGLGLWVAQIVAGAHASRIEYEAKEVNGRICNVFSVELPAVR